MKNLFLLCLCCFGLLHSSNAQEKSAPLRLEFSSNSIFPQGDNIRTFIQSWDYYVSKRKYNYSLQLSAFGQLNRRLELGLGLGYANLDAYTEYICDFCFQPNGDRAPSREGLYTKFRAIEMPLELRINWFKTERKIVPYVTVGMTGRMYLLYGYSVIGEQEMVNENDFSLGLHAGLGSRFILSPKWSLNVASHFMSSRYRELADGIDDNLPSLRDPLRWLNEWSVKVGVSRAF